MGKCVRKQSYKTIMGHSVVKAPTYHFEVRQHQSLYTFMTSLVCQRMPLSLRGSADFSEQHREPFSSENGDTWSRTTM